MEYMIEEQSSEYTAETGIIHVFADPFLDVGYVAEDRRILDEAAAPAPGVQAIQGAIYYQRIAEVILKPS